jgi:hypothetical protein
MGLLSAALESRLVRQARMRPKYPPPLCSSFLFFDTSGQLATCTSLGAETTFMLDPGQSTSTPGYLVHSIENCGSLEKENSWCVWRPHRAKRLNYRSALQQVVFGSSMLIMCHSVLKNCTIYTELGVMYSTRNEAESYSGAVNTMS